MESKTSMTKSGYKKSLRAPQRKGLGTVKTKMGILCYLRAIQGHFGGIPIEPELMGYCKNSSEFGRNTLTTEDFHGTFSPYWEKD